MISRLRIPGILAAVGLVVVMSGCALGGGTSSTTRATPTATTAPTTTSGSTSFPVKVYFSKHPETDSNVSAVFPVNRVSPTSGVATYALQQLIKGPTASEAAAGYFTELTNSLSGSSNCGGADFKVTLNTHVDPHTGIASAQQGTAVVQFCKTTSLAGDLTGARIKAQITATVKQFPNNQKVQILTNTGHCFDDLSGQDNC